MRNLSKSPLSARFHLTFPACKIKNAAKILAESATQRILPSFRRKPLVNFLGSFRSYRTSLTSRTSPRCYWEICLSDQSDQSDKSNPLSDEFESGSRALPLMGEMEGAFPFSLFPPHSPCIWKKSLYLQQTPNIKNITLWKWYPCLWLSASSLP